MAKKKVKKKSPAEPTFEQALGELEQIVSELEGGELPLADALEQYEQAVAHLKHCHQTLKQAEGRIELLSGVDEDGSPQSKPFIDPGGGSLEEKAAGRSRRRTANRSGVDDADSLF